MRTALPMRVVSPMTMPVPWSMKNGDGGAGVNIDAGAAVRVLGHHARHELSAGVKQAIGGAINGNRVQAGIAGDDLVRSRRRGICLECNLDVLGQSRTHFGQAFERTPRDGLGFATV